MHYLIYIIPFLIIFNLLILIIFDKIETKIHLYDFPDAKRKLHKYKTPLLGGLIIYVNIILFFPLIYFLGDISYFSNFNIYTLKQFIFFLFTLSLIFFIGIYDDKFGLSFEKRLLYIFISLMLFANYNPQFNINNINIETLNIFFKVNTISPLILSICIITYIVSCNMFDGINIQSPLYFLFILFILIYKNILVDLNIVLLIPLITIFYLNFRKKTFFGDSGIYLIGFLIAYSFVSGYNKNLISLEEIFLISFPQIFDATRVILMRLFKGKNPTIPDRTHIHHILIKKNKLILTVSLISIIYILPSLIFYTFKINILILIIFQILLYFFILNYNNAKRF